MGPFQLKKICWDSPDQWVTFGLWGMAALYFINFFVLGFLISPYDWDHLASYYELAWRYWVTSPGIPEYNPFLCGGQTLGGDPQLPIFHPLVILVPVLGAGWVLKLEMLSQLCLGAWGLHRWLRILGVSESGARWGLFLFVAGGGVVAKFFVGHMTLGFFFLLPVFFFLSVAMETEVGRKRWKKIAAYVLLAIYCGMYKPNFLIQGAPLLAAERFFTALRTRRLCGLFVLGLALIACGLVNAVTYLPSWAYFSQFPRRDFSRIFIPAYSLLANLFFPLKSIPFSWYGPGTIGRHEYSIFLGPVAVILAFLGYQRENNSVTKFSLLGLMLFAALLGLGTTTQMFRWLLPHTWLQTLWPGYASVRVPMRVWFGVYLVVIVFSSWGWTTWNNRGLRWGIILAGILPLFASAAVNLMKPTLFAHGTQWAEARKFPAEMIWEEGAYDNTYRYIRRGAGVINCMFNIDSYRDGPFPPGKVFPEIPGMMFQWENWSRIRIVGRRLEEQTVRVRLNASPYWTARGSGVSIVSKVGELMQLRLDKGAVNGELSFRQPLEKEAVLLSLGSLFVLIVGLGIFWWREGRVKATGESSQN